MKISLRQSDAVMSYQLCRLRHPGFSLHFSEKAQAKLSPQFAKKRRRSPHLW
ncbi:hypothetical protein HanRHA438_Chr06g0267651 [Helianthus annuus]|nr:hypothetical protein HanRHA438_Chr06g0267651 [Helianthus annuus]